MLIPEAVSLRRSTFRGALESIDPVATCTKRSISEDWLNVVASIVPRLMGSSTSLGLPLVRITLPGRTRRSVLFPSRVMSAPSIGAVTSPKASMRARSSASSAL